MRSLSLTRGERKFLQGLKDDFPQYAERCLKIRAKTGATLPLALNRAQRHMHERLEAQRASSGGRVRALVLKARQQGFSTYIEGRFYWKATHTRGVQAFILTHEQDATDNLFGMVKRFHAHCPQRVKATVGKGNAKALHFAKLD